MNNLLAAITDKFMPAPLYAAPALYSDVGGRIYLDKADQEAIFPYIVFFIVTDVPEYTFKDNLEDILLQFSIFSTSGSIVEIATIYNDLKSLFDDCSMVITSNTLIWFVRKNLVTMMDETTTPEGTVGVKAWHVDYSILMQKT